MWLRRARTRLRLANLYSGTGSIGAVVAFAEAVSELSAGEVGIKFVHGWGRADDPSEETSLLADVAAGEVDLAWVGTRAFGKGGVRSLDALQAPFLITSYEAEASVCRSGVARDALGSLNRIGLEGIALLGGELRKPFGLSRQLVGPSDYQGAIVRTHASVIGEETFRALGATPVLRSRAQMAHREHPDFDGMDNHCGALASWGYAGRLTSNVTLWPRTVTLVASAERFRGFGGDTQTLLRKAGDHAAEFAAIALAEQEQADLAALQRVSVECVTADSQQLAALRERVAPVYDSLRRDRSAAPLLEQLEQMLASPAGT